MAHMQRVCHAKAVAVCQWVRKIYTFAVLRFWHEAALGKTMRHLVFIVRSRGMPRVLTHLSVGTRIARKTHVAGSSFQTGACASHNGVWRGAMPEKLQLIVIFAISPPQKWRQGHKERLRTVACGSSMRTGSGVTERREAVAMSKNWANTMRDDDEVQEHTAALPPQGRAGG